MEQRLMITLIRSSIGRPRKHKIILRGLGLTWVRRTVVRPDTPAIRGMLARVSHLVHVQEDAVDAPR